MCPTDQPGPTAATSGQARGGHIPEVSVIIPVRNLESYIDDAIGSVLAQDFTDFELIVVDDGSTDGTQAKVRSWMQRDRRILLIGNIYRPGVSGARNTGLDAARGTFVAFLDGDDTWYPGSLGARVARLKSVRRGDFVHGVLDLVDEALVPLGPVIGAKRSISFDDTSGNPASLNACLFPRSLIGEFRFSEDLDSGEDWLFIAQILRTGAVSHFVPEGGGTYRVRADSKVNSDPFAHERALEPILDWVFGPEADPRYHPDYREGLRGYDRRKVVARRKFRALGDALLMRREREAAGLLEDIVKQDLVTAAGIKVDDVFSAVSLCRYFRVPADQIRELTPPIRDEMASVITSLSVDHVAPDFIESLWRSVFSESWAERMRSLR
jgi:glycosyltransferase involved in cell wall biosynthesis